MKSPDRQPIGHYFHVHLVSDSTGETLVNVVRASTSLFTDALPIEHYHSMVRSTEQLEKVLRSVEAAPGVVMFTIMDEKHRQRLELACARMSVPCVAVLDPALATLSRYLGQSVTVRTAAQHRLTEEYYHRIEAMHYAIAHDDGQNLDGLSRADVVLVGVSRTSKTPTCMYLAHRGVYAANVPLVAHQGLPGAFDELSGPLIVGLTTTPERLVQIRRNRILAIADERASNYAEEDNVRAEVLLARRIFNQKRWPVIDVTRRSIEETSARIINLLSERRDQN
jgi:[pyruvate, water dikinase]-phosphate phosphotransferase / [pyruvate, water dikinase] kinase